NTGARRNNAEILECLLAPFQKAITLAIAFIFALDVIFERHRIAEVVNNDGVVDNQINRHKRVDLFWISTKCLETITHCSQIDNRGNAGKVLHENASRTICDLGPGLTAVYQPFGYIFDIRLLNRAVILEAKQILKKHLHRERKLGNAIKTVLFSFGQTVIDIFLAPYVEGSAAFETVDRSEEHTSELQSRENLVCRLLLEKKKNKEPAR